jgi:hypothetical protein
VWTCETVAEVEKKLHSDKDQNVNLHSEGIKMTKFRRWLGR